MSKILKELKNMLNKRNMMLKYIINKNNYKNNLSDLTLKIQLRLNNKDSQQIQIKYYKKLRTYKSKSQSKHQLKI